MGSRDRDDDQGAADRTLVFQLVIVFWLLVAIAITWALKH